MQDAMADDTELRTLLESVRDGADLQARLDRLLREEVLAPGFRLPTEREIVLQTGLPRSAVRRALGALEASGRIVRHVGRGTFVAGLPAHLDRGEASSSPREIMDARLLIEPGILPVVVVEARQSDFDEIQRCLDGGDQNREYGLFERWDMSFHHALASASHNNLFVAMLEMLHAARGERLWGQMKQRSFSPDRAGEYVDDHYAIARAVFDRDGEAAQIAMRQHLLRVRHHLLGY